MEEEGHGQHLKATLSQQTVALQKLQIKIAQLEKRNQAQGQRPQQGRTRFGDVQRKQEHAIVQVKAKVSPILDDIVHKSSTTFMMHLSLSKSVITGLRESESRGDYIPGRNVLMDQKGVQCPKQTKLLKEENSVSNMPFQGRPNDSSMLTEIPKAEPEHELSQSPHHKWKPKSEQCVVQVLKSEESKVTTRQTENKKCFDPRISQEEHKNRAELSQEDGHTNQGCKEESFKEIPPDNHLLIGGSTPKMVRTEPTRSMKDHTLKKSIAKVHSRGVILSYLLKEEPPDAQSIPKPKQYQGKTLESQESMKADLLYLGAGYPVSRSKLCQGVGFFVKKKSCDLYETPAIKGSKKRKIERDVPPWPPVSISAACCITKLHNFSIPCLCSVVGFVVMAAGVVKLQIRQR
ncbi:hypothetical protein DY000_02030381 [Brassica cretica]|uniref:Shugoshin C-terminal domain-containing protein n=1 Tax=Brassica cretica TaxID=69181 RepID=A0ABQ7DEL0_BRACR|nr:hypothetical protein DY000_02030381 [Brassica cretica]